MKNSVKILVVAFLVVSVFGMAVAQAGARLVPSTSVDRSCCPGSCCPVTATSAAAGASNVGVVQRVLPTRSTEHVDPCVLHRNSPLFSFFMRVRKIMSNHTH